MASAEREPITDHDQDIWRLASRREKGNGNWGNKGGEGEERGEEGEGGKGRESDSPSSFMLIPTLVLKC